MCCFKKVIWFTGLSGSGKTTLAQSLFDFLKKQGELVYLLDGDLLREGLCSDLGFSESDREENIRRAGEVAKLFYNEGYTVICTFISPFCNDRERVRQLFDEGVFKEVYLSAPFHVCEDRDPKGLYKRARVGNIKNFTGLDSPYEAPENPDLLIDTGSTSIDASFKLLRQAFWHEQEVVTAHGNG